jgi:hypothetical protein
MCYKKILAVSICCFPRPEAEFNLAQHCSPLSGRKCMEMRLSSIDALGINRFVPEK